MQPYAHRSQVYSLDPSRFPNLNLAGTSEVGVAGKTCRPASSIFDPRNCLSYCLSTFQISFTLNKTLDYYERIIMVLIPFCRLLYGPCSKFKRPSSKVRKVLLYVLLFTTWCSAKGDKFIQNFVHCVVLQR